MSRLLALAPLVLAASAQKITLDKEMLASGANSGTPINVSWSGLNYSYLHIGVEAAQSDSKPVYVKTVDGLSRKKTTLVVPDVKDGAYRVAIWNNSGLTAYSEEHFRVHSTIPCAVASHETALEKDKKRKHLFDESRRTIHILSPQRTDKKNGRVGLGEHCEVVWEYSSAEDASYDKSHVNVILLKRVDGRLVVVEQLGQAAAEATSLSWTPRSDMEIDADYHIYVGANGNPDLLFTEGGQGNEDGTIGLPFYLRPVCCRYFPDSAEEPWDAHMDQQATVARQAAENIAHERKAIEEQCQQREREEEEAEAEAEEEARAKAKKKKAKRQMKKKKSSFVAPKIVSSLAFIAGALLFA